MRHQQLTYLSKPPSCWGGPSPTLGPRPELPRCSSGRGSSADGVGGASAPAPAAAVLGAKRSVCRVRGVPAGRGSVV